MQAEESAAVIGWTLETFGTPFVNWLKDKAQKEKWKRFDWPKAEQAYLDKLLELYDRVRILGNSTDVPLGNIFTQVYILDKPTARQRYDIEELRKHGGDRSHFYRQSEKRTHGMALVKNKQNLFILGKPGAGKTTFLKYIAIQAARKQLPRIPIFVSLNQWADSKWGKGENAALSPFIVEQFEICDFPDADLFIDYLLRKGQAVVLFDGLDEVKQEQEQRRRLTHLLQDFARKYSKCKHLITCRIAASDYAFANFVDVEIADFTPEQVREYARHWFGEQEKKFAAFTDELDKAENRGLAELCNTPLLLSLLCLTFDNDMRFPPTRAELYEDALDSLLRKWDSSRQIQRDEIYQELSHKRKLQLLMQIAVPTFQKGELFFRQRDLEKWLVDYLAKLPNAAPADTIDGTALLKAMEAQHSILVERAQGIYSFSHLTFQEYLTARYLAENQGKSVTADLIRRHLTDQRWREVFLLTATLLDDAYGLIHSLRDTTDRLVAEAPSLRRLLAWAHERTQQAPVPVGRRAAIQLAYIFLLLALARARAQARKRALDRVRALAHERELVLERAIDLDHERSRSLSRSLVRARTLAHATTPLVGFDYGLYYAWAYAALFAEKDLVLTDSEWQSAMQAFTALVQGVAGLADEGNRGDLGQGLLSVAIPSPAATSAEWQQYATALLAILRHQRDLVDNWDLTNEEIDKITAYFYATELLVQCLNVAAVTDRQAVLNGLLLPPADLDSEKV